MSREEREAFLAATRVGIVSVAEQARGPVTVPVWYHYAPGGDLVFVTGKTSRKLLAIEAVDRISFCVQTETPPYSYVSVEGPVTTGPADYDDHLEEMAVRYLGEEMGSAYLEATHPGRSVGESILAILRPERWWSVDYSKT